MQSPFILKEILDAYFENCGQEFKDFVEKVRDDMCVDMSVDWGRKDKRG